MKFQLLYLIGKFHDNFAASSRKTFGLHWTGRKTHVQYYIEIFSAENLVKNDLKNIEEKIFLSSNQEYIILK